MDFKEKIENDIKGKDAKEIWEKIYQAFDEGGSEKVKNILNEQAVNINSEYRKSINELEKIL